MIGAQLAAIDERNLIQRASAAMGTATALTALRPLPGGASSLTYSARVRHADVVVKVAPPGLPPVGNRDVLRQARLLTALRDVSGLPVPVVLGADTGDPPAVPPLFVMSSVPGEDVEPLLTPVLTTPPAAIAARWSAAAQMLAALHAVPPSDLGLDEEPVTLFAEVARWQRAFGTCPLPEAERRAEEAAHGALLAGVPAPLAPVVVHGDWRLGNMICAGPSIRAVIDWELWSIGDPRLDLAWLMLMADPEHPATVSPAAPVPRPGELPETYTVARGSAVPDLGWFEALVRYKQAAACALLVKNASKRGDTSPLVSTMRAGTGALLDAALDRLRRPTTD